MFDIYLLQRDAKTFVQSSARRSFNIWSALHHLWCTSSCLSDIWNWGTHLCYLVPIYILPVDIGFIHWKYLYDFGNHHWKVNSFNPSMNFVYPSDASDIMIIFIYSYCLYRYVAVCKPHRYRELNIRVGMIRRILIYTIPVATISVLLNIPKFFETKVNTSNVFLY